MRYLGLILLALLLASCAPAFEPAAGAAPGVALTAEETAEGTTYSLTAEPAVERVVLRFVGDLTTTAEDCVDTGEALECVVNEAVNTYEVPVSGDVQNRGDLPYGVVCREECYAIWLE